MTSMNYLYISLIFLLFIKLSIEGTKSKVENLFPVYTGDIYSGYLKTLIDGNELFYIYTPSQSSTPQNDPVLLWLNGGPGCSSLFGMLGEIGPVTTDNYSGVFKKNNYAWNMNLNTLFIEQPAGVGYSKCSDLSHNWTDVENAKNLFVGVKDFFDTFTDLKNRDFYIAGESYAGIFIPHLAVELLQDSASDKINLKGFLIGNALTDPLVDYDKSLVEFGFYRGLVAKENYDLFLKHCPHVVDELNPKIFPDLDIKKCIKVCKKISDNMNGSDMYGIYRPCPISEEISQNDFFYINKKLSIRKTILNNIKNIQRKNNNGVINGNKNKIIDENEEEEEIMDVWPTMYCDDDLTVDTFLNLNSTKEKMNIYDKSTHWTQCADLNYEWSDSIHLYNSTLLQHPDLKMWLLSGTEDVVISTLGTMRWIDKVGFNIGQEWKQWYLNDQIGGYDQKYKEGLVLVTIKGAGHMAPQDKRSEAKFVLDSFIKGILPSENKNYI